MLSVANVNLPAWQAVFLILLSCGSLVIALYCLLFMVPLKKFVRRIESLGGGMEGMKKHLDGVESRFNAELQRVESRQQDMADQFKNKVDRRVKQAEDSLQELSDSFGLQSRKFELYMATVDSLRDDISAHAEKCTHTDELLKEVQRDISVLAEETEGKLQKEARNSFYELEATMLSTLEVLRDELIPADKDMHSRESGTLFKSYIQEHKPSARSGQDDSGSKIISAGPLFSRSSQSGDKHDKNIEAEGEDEGENGS